MPYYALTDTDWPWDSQDEGRAIIVQADTPEEAVTKATEMQIAGEAEAEKIDRTAISGGVCWKVADLADVGFAGVTWENGVVTEVDAFITYQELERHG